MVTPSGSGVSVSGDKRHREGLRTLHTRVVRPSRSCVTVFHRVLVRRERHRPGQLLAAPPGPNRARQASPHRRRAADVAVQRTVTGNDDDALKLDRRTRTGDPSARRPRRRSTARRVVLRDRRRGLVVSRRRLRRPAAALPPRVSSLSVTVKVSEPSTRVSLLVAIVNVCVAFAALFAANVHRGGGRLTARQVRTRPRASPSPSPCRTPPSSAPSPHSDDRRAQRRRERRTSRLPPPSPSTAEIETPSAASSSVIVAGRLIAPADG